MTKTIAEALVSMRKEKFKQSAENLAWTDRGREHKLAALYTSRSGMGEITDLQLVGFQVEGLPQVYSANIKFVNGYGVEVRRGVRGATVGGELVIETTLQGATRVYYPLKKREGHWYVGADGMQRVSIHPELFPIGLTSVVTEFLKQL